MSKQPKVGVYPKRGIPNQVFKVVNKDAKFKAHHQKEVLTHFLEFKQGTATLEELVKLVESNEKMLTKLDTVQSPYNCIVYHANDLARVGYLTINDAPQAEKKIEIVAPSNKKNSSTVKDAADLADFEKKVLTAK